MESKRKYRVLFLLSHPVQYAAPLFRLLAQDERLEILVAYCSLQGAEPGKDPDFGVEVAWDVPLLDGYSWKLIPNRSPRPGIRSFLGLMNPGLWKLVRKGNFDAVVVYGYAYFSYWIALLAAKRTGVPILISADSVRLAHQRGGWWWKRWLKPPVIRLIFHRVADVVLVPSTPARRFIESLGVPPARIGFTHYTVDNDYFTRASAGADRNTIRSSWRVAPEAVVVLFCAKLTRWKRPQDILEAFAAICSEEPIQKAGALLVFAGDGPLRGELEACAEALRVQDRVRFLGFVNQSRLPGVYAASDLLVLPSEHEAWGLVVNEAMSCGIPAVVSDQVGAGFDLITPGVTGEIYPVGNVEALAAILRRLVPDRNRLDSMGRAAFGRMATWSFREHLKGLVGAIETASVTKPH
jgi:glycosyltransferase involved in cell wall biosynthesis